LRRAGRSRTIGRGAALLLLGGAALATGCGNSQTANTAELRLQREDLLAVSHALSGAQASVNREVAATKAAWPSVVNSLPAHTSAAARASIQAAARRAAQLTLPAVFQERNATALTGPASGLAGIYRSFSGLAARGWQLIGAAIQQIEHGSPTAASFARANVPLYIDSVYDGHFSLAQIGKQLTAAYTKLGGPAAFDATLTQEEVDALARAYSEANDRLHPHTGVRLGS